MESIPEPHKGVQLWALFYYIPFTPIKDNLTIHKIKILFASLRTLSESTYGFLVAVPLSNNKIFNLNMFFNIIFNIWKSIQRASS